MTPVTEMRNASSGPHPLLILGVLATILAGCASPSSQFYQLHAMPERTPPTSDPSTGRGITVTIGPVHMPDYLERPQMVTRAGDNELKLSEFHRWAGSLENDVTRVLVEDISGLLPADQFSVTRWVPYLDHQRPASCRVEVFVDRFDGTLDDSVVLKAQWVVFGQSSSALLRKESLTKEPVEGDRYDALAAAMSRVLGSVSRDIGDGVLSVCEKVQTGA
jgi:uncharacterized protein